MRRPAVPLLLLCLAACGEPEVPAYGVTRELAEARAERIESLRVNALFTIPAARQEEIAGRVTFEFTLTEAGDPLVLDFRGDSGVVRSAEVNGKVVSWSAPPGHVVLPAAAFHLGVNEITLTFRAGEEALNRNDDFLYALFVPDRASTALPIFDQPDLKARYTLTLNVPTGWTGFANGPLLRQEGHATGETLTFGETEPLPTYLFTFAAGKFQTETAERDGRTLTMLHRETDPAKVARNREAIFDLHATALRWLEEYTGIPYPFGKFAFLAVPSFQFGGMEHPGAVWYRASSLFLDESATRSEQLGRASLIAHETAHMWFGDLVTMRWFNDVWMKEVFANFMAAKIVRPSFPDIDHDLRFFLAHHPTAYGVDRTLGANPIRQDLANLRDAGSLYGAIIYQKAPVVMRQLEQLIGEGALREGLRTYLDRYRFGNATWPDLIAILDDLTPDDLASWSQVWVTEAGRPLVDATWAAGALTVSQQDPAADRGRRWPQPVGIALAWGDTVHTVTATLRDASTSIALDDLPRRRPDLILPGADGVSYGRFIPDSGSVAWLLRRLPLLRSPIHRAVAWQGLREAVLAGRADPGAVLALTLVAAPAEADELVLAQTLGVLRETYWRHLSDDARTAAAPGVERVLRGGLDRAPTPSRKGAWFQALVAVTTTPEGVAWLDRIWRREEPPRGLPLSEPQYVSLAEALALRGRPDAEAILDTQQTRITNPDRADRFRFVRPALSPNPSVRDSFFASLADVDNRRREPWVTSALGYLNHPLRAGSAERYLPPALALLPEIQATGDIFFPLSWLNALLDGHRSPTAAAAVARYLEEAGPSLPPRLRGKLLQAADDLFRAARIVHGWTGGPKLEGE